MRTLALETSTRRAGVALVEDGNVVAALFSDDPMTHAETIVPLVERAFAESGWARSSLDRVAAGLGPGSFTGVRVALATAKGIALALDLPIVGVGSLEAMAAAAGGARAVAALLDARKGEVFYAVYAPGGAMLLAPGHVRREDVAAVLAAPAGSGPLVLAGEVATELALADYAIVRSPESDLPDPRWVARLAAHRPADDLDALEPAYVRPPDVRLPTSHGG